MSLAPGSEVDRLEIFVALLGLLLLAAVMRSWRQGYRSRQAAEARIRNLEAAILKLAEVSSARLEDARSNHDEDVVELLESLLELTTSLRRSLPGTAPVPGRQPSQDPEVGAGISTFPKSAASESKPTEATHA